MSRDFTSLYELGEVPDYEPAPDQSVAARAAAAGVAPAEVVYDILARGGVIYLPAANYTDNSMAAIRTMLSHPASVLGLGDGGAHCGLLCDASMTTHMLARWAIRGEHDGGDAQDGKMPLEQVVHALTARTAAAVGLADRGRIAPGLRADLNVIDIDRIGLFPPQPVADLPGGAFRIGQRARGYEATIVAGEVTRRGGEPTGALPGRLVRKSRASIG